MPLIPAPPFLWHMLLHGVALPKSGVIQTVCRTQLADHDACTTEVSRPANSVCHVFLLLQPSRQGQETSQIADEHTDRIAGKKVKLCLLPVDAVGTANCLHHPVGNVYLSDATCCQDRIMHYSLYHKRIFFQIFNKSFFVDRKASLYRSIAVRQAREMFNKKLQLLVILGTYVCPQSIQPLFLPVEICQLCSCTAF
ncbi:uncharacterized protein LOC142784408 isoform X1 [Rhipicephalus microplus]|uniref:uncharacterized protein LOC142784408 isoform X1 n=1 Tax=Rhipicephalus microplus TaxID=6941 RepID=UPI003F6C3EDF